MVVVTISIGIVLGAALGGAFVWLWLRARVAASEARLAASADMKATFQALADSALRSNQSSLVDSTRTTLEPLSDSLIRLETQVRDLEMRRERVFGTLEERLAALSRETGTLANALKNPQ